MSKHRRSRRRITGKFILILVLFIAALAMGILAISSLTSGEGSKNPGESADGSFLGNIFSSATPEETPVEAEPTETPEPTPTPVPEFSPAAVEGTRQSDFGVKTEIEVNGELVSSYLAADTIDFLEGDKYTGLEGVITFRGNNFRDSPSYGVVKMISKTLDVENAWTASAGSVSKMYGEGSWTGCGWTGQPLIVKWPEETKKIMNLYDSAKAKADLVEVIYATMDGHIYFLDLETGERTRDPMLVDGGGFPFKGAGALDPRGYPLMYLGSGDDSSNQGKGSSHASIISLIDCTVLYEFGEKDDFSLRGLSYFDSSALVDAETDTLIYPGENGILYIIHLNTNYDAAAGTISVSPETVKWRYQGSRTNTSGYDGSSAWWLGIEDSAIIWRGHAIFTDNGGLMMCLDLNTLELDWVQDTLDDTNCTAVMSIENGHPYVYTSTSFHAGWRADKDSSVEIPIWKIDALTGERVWTNTNYRCQTISGVSGGVQGSFAIGKGSLEGMVFAPVAMTDGSRGKLVALSTADGHEVWCCDFAGYPWSSPVPIYDENGNGYLIQCNSTGYIHLIDGQTGTILYEAPLGANVEASPAIYGNRIVIGTRGGVIYGIEIK